MKIAFSYEEVFAIGFSKKYVLIIINKVKARIKSSRKKFFVNISHKH